MPDQHMMPIPGTAVPVANPVPGSPSPNPNVQTAVVSPVRQGAGPATAPPQAATTTPVPPRQGVMVNKGVYKGKKGWVDTQRGKNGYSPSGKSIYIIFKDDNGNEVRANNYIRTASVTLTNWQEVERVQVDPGLQSFFQEFPTIGQKTAELAGLLNAVTFADEASKQQCIQGFTRIWADILVNAPQGQ